MSKSIKQKSTFPIFFLLFALMIGTPAESMAASARQLVPASIDESQTVELPGNTRPEAMAQNDLGRADDSLALSHMQLLLNRPAEREAALKGFIDQLHNPQSPYFHRWLTAAQIRSDYGPAETDIAQVSHWLSKHGLTVHGVQASGMMIDFSGTAGQVREAFKTEIHKLKVGGAAHIANIANPRIPAALSGVVKGIVSLHDFRPHAHFRQKPAYTFNSGSTHALVPADLATIYNLNPLFGKGITGAGQTIVVIEDTDVYSTADWTTFRSTFGLSGYTSGSFTQVHPNCADPGVVAGDEMEAELDAEWASAAAPDAAIVLASCPDTTTTFGGLIALQNLVNGSNPPAIVSISYGECEAYNGAASNAAYYSVYQQAVSEGVSVFVSAGDEGAAGCDADERNASHGIGVSGFASTPYNVAVGGTDFGDTYAGTTANYWSSTNTAAYGSALSYVPEIPWNDSCASSLISSYLGYSTPYGSSGFCNSKYGKSYLTTAGGSGGPSGCATGAPSKSGVVGGTCAGWPKPSWQSLQGNPADAVRDLPDVSLFASNGVWDSYYIFCDSDVRDGGSPCTGDPSGWTGAGGGTSFGSPIWAGIQALVNQNIGGRQGNPNTVYYSLAAAQYRAGENCNSSNSPSGNCIFYDITRGDIDVNCTGSNNCYLPSGNYGVLSTSDGSYSPAYASATGWDFATGIGSVNAYNLINNWVVILGNQTISFGAAPTVIVGGTGTVSATGGASGNPVTFTSTTTSVCTVSGSTVTGAAVGTCTIAANQAGNAQYKAAPQATLSFSIGQGSQAITYANCLFNWAEINYPNLFAPAGSTTAFAGVYTYRYYSTTNSYLGVSSANGHVYYQSPNGGTPQDEGTLYDWLPKASCPVPTPDDCLFNWAETNYSSLFAPADATTEVSGIYTYRYYSATNAYLGVSSADNNVYYAPGGVLHDEGQSSYWLPQAGCE